MSLKVTGVYFSASSAGAGPGKMKATIRASRLNNSNNSQQQEQEQQQQQHQQQQQQQQQQVTKNAATLHSQSLDHLHMNFEEKRQIIASSLSLVDFLHPPKAHKGNPSVPSSLTIPPPLNKNPKRIPSSKNLRGISSTTAKQVFRSS